MQRESEVIIIDRDARLRNANSWLNTEALDFQAKNYKGNRKKFTFTPCPKAEVYRREREGGTRVFSEIWNEVLRVECPCHYSLTADDLIEMEYDNTIWRYSTQGPTAELWAEVSAKIQARAKKQSLRSAAILRKIQGAEDDST